MRFADVDAMILDFLEPRVTVPVHLSVPKNRPGRFIRAWCNGGAAQNRVVERVVIVVDAWGEGSVDASELAETARAAFLHEYTAMPLVRGVVEQSRPYSNPDPDSGAYRYRFSVQLTVRARRT